MFNTIFPKIHKEGYKFLAISILATFIILFFSKLLGILFIILGTTMLIGEGALLVSSSSQASNGDLVNALSFFNISQALGSFGVSTVAIGFAIVGLGLAIQKNLNTILAYAFIVIGLVGSVLSLWDYTSDLMFVWYLGSALLALISGILILRSKE